ncbi:MAG: glycosyltransferase family 39 protein [Methanosarcinaceae archaeon]|nr:glycosyltransferase family 39 protein [Methanosarcinaceae archaeon]
MQIRIPKQDDVKVHHILLAAILLLSLLLQSYKLGWGLVTDNMGFNGLSAFHIVESRLVSIPYNMIQTGDLNPHFFDESSLFYNSMYLVFSIISKFVVIDSFTQYIWIARVMASVFTVCVVFLVYLIGKEVGNTNIGLYSALLMALNPYYMWFSSIAKEDPMMVLFITLAMYLFIRYLKSKNPNDFFLTMAAAGFAVSTKYPAGIMLPFLMTLYIFYDKEPAISAKFEILAKSFGVYCIAFVVGTPYSVLAFREFLAGAVGELGHYTTGHPGFDHFTWFVHVQTITGLWDATNIWGKGGYGLTLVLLLAGLIMIPSQLKKEIEPCKSYMWYMLVGWISLSSILFCFLISVKMGNQMMILTPAAMVVAGFGFEKMLAKIPSIHLKTIVGSVFILLIFTYAASGIVSSQNDNRYYAADWMLSNIEPELNLSIGTTLFVYIPDEFMRISILPVDVGYMEYLNFDYIILSSWEYERYLESPETYPVESNFYSNVLAGNTIYKPIAHFERTETARQRTLNFGLGALMADEYGGEVDIHIFKRMRF